MKHAFIDVEAFRLKKPWKAPLCNVAAVIFDSEAKVLASNDYYIDPNNFPTWSRVEDSTITWWKGQAKYQELIDRMEHWGDTPLSVMKQLKFYLNSEEVEAFWFAGPQYDQIMLEAYFDSFGIKYPWKYNQCRDFRTIRKQHQGIMDNIPPNANAHLALDDCLYDVGRLADITLATGIRWF